MSLGSEPHLPSERRQLTVIFSDLVGSTELASALDPEDTHEILASYQTRVSAEIESRGGTVSQFQGDGVVAYFGWPVAHDTDSRYAVEAALAIVATVGDLHDELPLLHSPLAARVGVHSGVVVVAAGAAGGESRRAEMFGDVPNMAARLQSLASPAEVVVSSSTAALVRDWFNLHPLGSRDLKGFPAPVEVFRVGASTGIRSRFELADATPFVDRRRESRLALQQLQLARDGPTRVAVVCGEPGIGKSRLVGELILEMRLAGATIVSADCAERDRLSPLQPFVPLMGKVPRSAAEVVEWIQGEMTAEVSVLVVEDCQWADPTTIEVLNALRHRPLRLFVLVTSRREQAQLDIDADVNISLPPLGHSDSAHLVSSLSETRLSESQRSTLVRVAGGVPLFLEELVRAARADPERTDLPEPAVPLTLGEVLAARLDGLGPAKRTAQFASVVGSEFDAGTARAAAEGTVVEGDLIEHLSTLVETGTVVPTGNRDRYCFRHGLIQQAAYESLLRRDRRVAHGRVAGYLARSPAHPDSRPEVLALHLSRAGRAEEAIACWRQAARQSARSGLYKEAASHLRAAVELLGELPAGDDRDGLEIRLRMRLGQYLAALDQADPSTGENLRRAAEIASSQGDVPALVESSLSLAPHYQALGDYPAVHLSLSRAADACEQHGITQLATTVSLLKGPVLIWEGRLAEGQSLIAETLAGAGVSIDEEPESGNLALGGLVTDVIVGSYVMYGLAECLVGNPAEAEAIGRRASELAISQSSVHALCMSSVTRAITKQLCSDANGVRVLARQVLRLPEDKTTADFRRWAQALNNWADGRPPDLASSRRRPFMLPYLLTLRADLVDDRAESLSLLEEALASARSSGELFAETEILRVLGCKLAEGGDLDRGSSSFDAALQVAAEQGAGGLAARVVDSWRRWIEGG